MKLKTYQAYTMAEALGAVKRDLGESAVILNTRSFKRGGFFGLGRKTVVQVTAGVPAPSARDQSPRGTKPHDHRAPTTGRETTKLMPAARAGSGAAQRAYRASASGSSSAPRTSPIERDEPADTPESVTDGDRHRTRRLAQAMMVQFERSGDSTPPQTVREHSSAPATKPAEVGPKPAESGPATSDVASSSPDRYTATSARPDPQARIERAGSKSDAEPASTASVPVAQRFVLALPSVPVPAASREAAPDRSKAPDPPADQKSAPAPVATSRPAESSSAPIVSPPAAAGARFNESSAAMQEELGAIRRMVSQVLQRQVVKSGHATPTMPTRLFEMYLKLIGQDVSEELADQVVDAVRGELEPDELEDENRVRRAVLRHLAEFIPVATHPVPEQSPDGRPLTIALIGPTGVGKTTTLAKLAASFKLRHGKKVGLITSDTYRIAAVDQLRTYANIIGLPLQVVLTPAEMRQAVHALQECEVILIDTAGRGQNDASRLEELRQFLDAASPHEVHLVLSSTASEKVLVREAEAFSRLGIHKVVLTKLDEAVSFGMLVNVIRSVGTQLSFVTTGQEVPDHIEVGRAERLAELILGGEVRNDGRPAAEAEVTREACAV